MQHLRCECGKAEYWDGGVPAQDCQGCDACGKTFARDPSGHKDRAPHDLEIRYDQRTGKPKKYTCTKCYGSFPMETAED